MSETDLITTEQRELAPIPDTERPVTGPPDLMAHMMQLPVEQMQEHLSEYWDRRQAFRAWLYSKFVKGVHFGFPPGLEPEFDSRGYAKVWMKGGYQYISPEQWTIKPSLFKAGAQFICALLYVRPEFEADMGGWEQLGKPADTFVYTCRIISKSNGQVLGQGRGVRKVGEKKMDANASLKMCQKAALVDAVINAYGLSDLFTQDTEDSPSREPHANPEADGSKPKQQPRAQRVTKEELAELHSAWCEIAHDPKDSEEFFALIRKETDGRDFNPRQPGQWTRDEFTKVAEAIRVQREGEYPPDGQ